MTVNTHCLPTGALGTNELPCPQVSAALMEKFTATPGTRRGVVVWLHGMSSAAGVTPAVTPADDDSGFFPTRTRTFLTGLAADHGWEVINPTYAEQLAPGSPSLAIQNDIGSDTGHGSRYLAQALRHWDHIVLWIKANYGDWPIVPFGTSWGGWHVLQIAANRASTITAYGLHVPATILSQAAPGITAPADFSTVNTTGLDTTTNMLNAVTKPGIIGWGTNDAFVGYTNTQAIYNAASGAGAPVTSNATADSHSFPSTDSTTYLNWFTSTVDPLAPANR